MAITSYILDYLLTLTGKLDTVSRSILELGESQTFEFDLASALPRISELTGLAETGLATELAAARNSPSARIRFLEARLIYEWLFGCAEYHAADLGASNELFRLDLNYPFDLKRRFEIVINNGTSEHIFNQANVFAMVHQHTEVGGYMIHYTPGLGWIDHGFYNVQPSFFFDLAKYNCYEIVSCVLANQEICLPLYPGFDIAAFSDQRLQNSLICACLRRCSPESFRFPTQYHYQ
jgi:hypothetical protein